MQRPSSYFAWLRVVDLPSRGVAARQLIAALPLIIDNATLECGYKLATIADKSGLSVAVVKRAKKELLNAGLIAPITVDGQASTGKGNAATFGLSMPVAPSQTGAPVDHKGCASEPLCRDKQVRQWTQTGAPVNFNGCASEPVPERNKEYHPLSQPLSHPVAEVGAGEASDADQADEPVRFVEDVDGPRLVSRDLPPDPPAADVAAVCRAWGEPSPVNRTAATANAARDLLRHVGVAHASDLAAEAAEKSKPLRWIVPAAKRAADEAAHAPVPSTPRRRPGVRVNAA